MKRIHSQLIRGLALACLGFPSFAPAADWPQWRGPAFNGSSPETDLPTTFSRTEGVRWVAELPGPSGATPIVWRDRVFVSSTDEPTRSLVALCLDAGTGKLLWREEIGPGFSQDRLSNYASPSPVTDGQLAWFFYGNGELVALDFSGKRVWARNLQKDYGQFAFLWTFGSSPLLHEGRLIVPVLQRNVPVNGRGKADGPIESFLLALDPKTGKELWRHVRPSEAVAEALESYTTPIPFTHAGRPELLIAGGDCLTGHDPSTGRELWRWGTWNTNKIGHWRLVPSPCAAEGVVLACAPKGAPIYAIKAGGNGDLGASGLAWTTAAHREVASDVSTPLFYRGRFFVLNSDRKVLSCVDPATGKLLWSGTLESPVKFEASPTGADGRIFMVNHRADVFVADAGDAFKLLHTAAFGQGEERNVRASIAVAGGCLFIRTASKLYCVGKS